MIGDCDPPGLASRRSDASAHIADDSPLISQCAPERLDLGGAQSPVRVPEPESGKGDHGPVLAGKAPAHRGSESFGAPERIAVKIHAGAGDDLHRAGMEIMDSAILTISS